MGLFDFIFGSNDYGNHGDSGLDFDHDEHYGRSKSNWTDREDWNCGNHDTDLEDGMSGFDSYEENDF